MQFRLTGRRIRVSLTLFLCVSVTSLLFIAMKGPRNYDEKRQEYVEYEFRDHAETTRISYENFHEVNGNEYSTTSVESLLNTGDEMSEIAVTNAVQYMDPPGSEDSYDVPPLILLWNAQQVVAPVSIPKDQTCGGGCRLSNDRAKLNESDAVVFKMKEFNTNDVPNPNFRNSDQVYVWWSEESSWTSKYMYNYTMENEQVDEAHFFNWTMTYRLNSDVNAMMIPYKAKDFVMQLITKRRQKMKMDNPVDKLHDVKSVSSPKSEKEKSRLRMQAKRLISKKTKTAIWIASNCGYTAGAVLRRKIVTNLQFLGLQVDVFGECGNTNIPDDLPDFLELISQYKFSLAFENSLHCQGYVTEKFWYNGLYAGTVPVVWGPMRTDIEAVAPEKSYIFYEDYNSSEALVHHLLALAKTSTAYMEYLSWWWESPGVFPVYGITEFWDHLKGRKATYDFETTAFCDLCSMLNRKDHLIVKKSVRSMKKWWYEGERTTCLDMFHAVKRVRYGSSRGVGYEVVEFS